MLLPSVIRYSITGLIFTLTFQYMVSQKITGEYSLQGIQDMAAGFRFSKDGKFDFFYIYGVSDRNASGTYTVEGDTIKLHSDKEIGKDFPVTKESKKGNGFTIQASDPNEYLLRHIIAIYFIGDTPIYAESNEKGLIHIDVPTCDKIYLKHDLFPDYPTLIKDENNTDNSFEVTLSPSLAQVTFKGIDLFIKDKEQTCMPNYFIPFQNIRFVKQ